MLMVMMMASCGDIYTIWWFVAICLRAVRFVVAQKELFRLLKELKWYLRCLEGMKQTTANRFLVG